MSSKEEKLLTAEDLWNMPGDPRGRELVRGRLITAPVPDGLDEAAAQSVVRILRSWAQDGSVLARESNSPDKPDISYVRPDRIVADRAIEVISPSETAYELHEKIRGYFRAGTPLVWTVFPATREVVAHTPNGIGRTFRDDDTLEFPDVLPGFRCKVREIFA